MNLFAYKSFALARTLAVASPVALATGIGAGFVYGSTVYVLGLWTACALAWLAHVEARNVRRTRSDRRKRVARPNVPRALYVPKPDPQYNGISDGAYPALKAWGSPW